MSRPIVSVSPVWDALPLGDAAGLTDEFTAEGIAYAIHSANLGADTVLRSDDAVFRYPRSINHEVQPELDAARAISRLYYPCITTWSRLTPTASKHVNYIWRAFFRVMRGESSYVDELAQIPLSRFAIAVVCGHEPV